MWTVCYNAEPRVWSSDQAVNSWVRMVADDRESGVGGTEDNLKLLIAFAVRHASRSRNQDSVQARQSGE